MKNKDKLEKKIERMLERSDDYIRALNTEAKDITVSDNRLEWRHDDDGLLTSNIIEYTNEIIKIYRSMNINVRSEFYGIEKNVSSLLTGLGLKGGGNLTGLICNDEVDMKKMKRQFVRLAQMVDKMYRYNLELKGEEYSNRQSKAGKAKNKIDKVKKAVDDQVKELAAMKDAIGYYMESEELWSLLYDRLGSMGLNPREYGGKDAPFSIRYDGCKKCITRKYFGERVSRYRRKPIN